LAFKIARSAYDIALLIVLSGILDALPSSEDFDPVFFSPQHFMTYSTCSLSSGKQKLSYLDPITNIATIATIITALGNLHYLKQY
jgi:hypothetical protein